MRPSRHALALAAAGASTLLASCFGPTEVDLRITTEACAPAFEAGIYTGSATSDAPVAVTSTCTGAEPKLGNLVVVPTADRDGRFRVEAVLAVGALLDECQRAGLDLKDPARGCVVARRRVAFRPHRTSAFTVRLSQACLNVPCDAANETCDVGRCVPIEQCTEEGCPREVEGALPSAPSPPLVDSGAPPTSGTCAPGITQLQEIDGSDVIGLSLENADTLSVLIENQANRIVQAFVKGGPAPRVTRATVALAGPSSFAAASSDLFGVAVASIFVGETVFRRYSAGGAYDEASEANVARAEALAVGNDILFGFTRSGSTYVRTLTAQAVLQAQGRLLAMAKDRAERPFLLVSTGPAATATGAAIHEAGLSASTLRHGTLPADVLPLLAVGARTFYYATPSGLFALSDDATGVTRAISPDVVTALAADERGVYWITGDKLRALPSGATSPVDLDTLPARTSGSNGKAQHIVIDDRCMYWVQNARYVFSRPKP